MKKQIKSVLGLICYGFGIVFATYVGLWQMICRPLGAIYFAFVNGELTLSLIIACAIKILFSTTLSGLIWCIGYIGYNHFKGTEDPDWEVLEEQRRYRDSTSA